MIGLDLSESNPLVSNKSYAASAGALVAQNIKSLPMASKVMLRTFGSYSGQKNNVRFDTEISSQGDEKPPVVAKHVEDLIAGVPEFVRAGSLEVQDRTNILSFLEDMAQFVDCSKMDTTVILVSDGIEDSEYARLKHGESLPAPSPGLYRGCAELLIVGLGQGADSPSFTERLRSEWGAWAKAAGFRDFEGLSNW